MTTKNIEEQKKYEYWLYQTNPLRRSRMIRMTERGISPKDLYEMKEEELKKLWRSICQNGQESVTERDIALVLESRRTFDLQGEYAKLQEDDSGEYAGIGVTVSKDADTGYVRAVNILEGAPAEKVDIQPDDIIVQIGDYEIKTDDDLDYLVSLIRGEAGTDVTLKIYRERDKAYHDVTITREIVEYSTVSSFMIDDKIGYVRITQFIDNTDELFQKAVEKLKKNGMQALMIDVRSDPGGMLTSVVNICDYLLPEGTIVSIKDKNGKVVEEYKSTDDEYLDMPMVVLTNEYSASASEILTSALKEFGAATVVGKNTYGKGIVQSVIPLGDGTAIKLTTQKYFTHDGNDIHKKGVAPDIEVDLPDDYTYEDFQGKNDSQYQKGIEVLKEKLK